MESNGQNIQMLRRRRYGLGIWALGLGYYLFYTPYSGLTKGLAIGLLTADGKPINGAVLLPVVAITTMAGMLAFITAAKWWRYAGKREFAGRPIPFPRRATFFSGVCLAVIMGTTTLAFSFAGLSIVLVLVLLRGGILIIGPLVDAIVLRRVRWFSWAAMLMSLTAVMIALADVTTYKLTLVALIDIAAYLAAYFFKLQLMSKLAKCEDRSTTLRYFVEEQMVAAPVLVFVVIMLAVIGAGPVMQSFRAGLTTFLATSGAMWAAAAGLCYAGLCVCTTMIFLDRRENTFCIPMHCGSSMLAGFTATAFMSHYAGQSSPSSAQNLSAALILIALGFLSPLHHFDRILSKLRRAPGYAGFRPAAHASRVQTRVILFVCSGNTCRSPMAAAIARTEIASHLGLRGSEHPQARIEALSAGLSATVGTPMVEQAKEALRQLGVEPNGHQARQLTPELATQAERIFCMTESQRQAVTGLAPAVADRTLRLDAEEDIEDPMGKGPEVYLACAQQLQGTVRTRLDELEIWSAATCRRFEKLI